MSPKIRPWCTSPRCLQTEINKNAESRNKEGLSLSFSGGWNAVVFCRFYDTGHAFNERDSSSHWAVGTTTSNCPRFVFSPRLGHLTDLRAPDLFFSPVHFHCSYSLKVCAKRKPLHSSHQELRRGHVERRPDLRQPGPSLWTNVRPQEPKFNQTSDHLTLDLT